MPDYGYYNWLLDPAFQPNFSTQYLPSMLVTVYSSGCPPDWFFRISLHGRSLSKSTFKRPFDQLSGEKRINVRKRFIALIELQKPKLLPFFPFPEPTLEWTFDGWFDCWWTPKASFPVQLQLFRNADPKIRMIRFMIRLRIKSLFHSFQAAFYRSSDEIKILQLFPIFQTIWRI